MGACCTKEGREKLDAKEEKLENEMEKECAGKIQIPDDTPEEIQFKEHALEIKSENEETNV